MGIRRMLKQTHGFPSKTHPWEMEARMSELLKAIQPDLSHLMRLLARYFQLAKKKNN